MVSEATSQSIALQLSLFFSLFFTILFLVRHTSTAGSLILINSSEVFLGRSQLLLRVALSSLRVYNFCGFLLCFALGPLKLLLRPPSLPI